jgi:hypothetical protein
MRVLKPTGSAVFIIQPNSECVGRMRTWLWEFLAWVGKDWGVVQDCYWWNYSALPVAGAPAHGLLRPSVKYCVWIGPATCFRDQCSVLWEPNWDRVAAHAHRRLSRSTGPSGQETRYQKIATATSRRGGSTPFNLLPIPNANSNACQADRVHGGKTPDFLIDWWLRYLCPPGGMVLDPFNGSGTVTLAALRQGKPSIGIETLEKYHRIAQCRCFGRTPA